MNVCVKPFENQLWLLDTLQEFVLFPQWCCLSQLAVRSYCGGIHAFLRKLNGRAGEIPETLKDMKECVLQSKRLFFLRGVRGRLDYRQIIAGISKCFRTCFVSINTFLALRHLQRHWITSWY